ncbi:MAG: cupin domain-containing protein [Flavobacterium sp.]
MDNPKTYYNPINGEYTKILESSDQTGGEYTHFEVKLVPGGGNPVHFHTKFSEEFIAVKGKLGLLLNGKKIYLRPGDNVLVDPYAKHRFFNDTNEAIVFRVILRKGQQGFERFLKVMFGLANDGMTMTKNQVPKNIYHLAILYHWGDTHLVNPFNGIAAPVFKLLYKRAMKLGIDKKLTEKYCK